MRGCISVDVCLQVARVLPWGVWVLEPKAEKRSPSVVQSHAPAGCQAVTESVTRLGLSDGRRRGSGVPDTLGLSPNGATLH